MRHAGIYTDHQIHQITQGGRVAKVLEFVSVVSDTAAGQYVFVGVAHFFLQAHVLAALGQVQYELLQAEAAGSVILVRGAAAPHQAHAWLGFFP